MHRRVDDSGEIRPERLEIDLVAEPRAEGLERALGVVAAAVEATVDDSLDPAAGGAEERGDGQGRAGDCEVVPTVKPLKICWSPRTIPK